MEKDDGGQAFPLHIDAAEGMTLRDYFAAKAMQSLLHAWISSPACKDDDSWVGDQHLAQEAYVIADAMLRARGR